MIRVFVLLFALTLSACASNGGSGANRNGESAAEINVRLGLGYLQQGRPQLALDNLKRAIELNPRLADAHHYAAEAYRQLQQHARADLHFKKALKLAPKDSSIKNNYGVYLCDRGQYAKADRYFSEVAEDIYYRSAAEALENAGICARKSGDIDLAVTRFHEAIEHDARRARSLYQLADLANDAGEYAQGRGFIQRYFSVAQVNAPSLWLAIQIEHGLGNEASVREYATRLYKNFPDSKEAKEFKEFWANQ